MTNSPTALSNLVSISPPQDPDTDAIVRAAWAYYVEGLTQNEIADRLGYNRVRINRMLAQARERGMVQIRINAPTAIALEREVEVRYGLSRVIVVPTPGDPALIPQAIAVAAGNALSDRITDGMSVGVGWGRTLRLSVLSVERRPLRNLSVVSLLGGLTRGSVMNAYETASRLADLFGAECFYIAGPVYTDTEASRDLLTRQPILEDALTHARDVQLAFVSIGSLAEDATMVRLGLLTPAELASLREAGAIGDLCGHFINAAGDIVDHPVNRRVIGLSPHDLAQVPTVIMASGGPEKVEPIRAALTMKAVHVLVTDEATAQSLVGDPARGP